MIGPRDDRNIILSQIFSDENRKSVKEVKPYFYDKNRNTKALALSPTKQLMWYPFIDGASNTNDNGYNIFKDVTENKLNIRSLEPGKNVKLSYTKNNSLRIDFQTSQDTLNFKETDIFNQFEEGDYIEISKSQDNKIVISVKDIPEPKILSKEGKLLNTSIFLKDDRIGLGRKPFYDYKLDIDIPKDRARNAIHMGDGTYGFSIGNGTSEGFLPQLIGVGANSNDAGVYIVGKTSRSEESETPLIIFDGRDRYNKKVNNRPIVGITNGDYENFDLTVNYNGKIGINKKPGNQRVEIEGNIKASDFVLDNNLSTKDLLKIIQEQKNKIDKLYDLVEKLIDKM